MEVYKNLKSIPNFLYHGTTSDCIEPLIEGIVIERSRRQTDFGEGFYLTANIDQAAKWALFKKDINPKESVLGSVLRYEVDKEKLEGLNSRFFENPTVDWSNFIYVNRALIDDLENNIDEKYDVVYGPIGDGFKITKKIRERKRGKQKFDPTDFNKEIISIKYLFPENHQFSFHSKRAVEALVPKGVELV